MSRCVFCHANSIFDVSYKLHIKVVVLFSYHMIDVLHLVDY